MKKDFNKLSKAEQRVLVAKDVLKQIAAGRYVPEQEGYINDLGIGWNADIKKNFKKIQNCAVCAVGACILSITHFKNQLTTKDVGIQIQDIKNQKIRKLLKLFSPSQLYLIETAFEGIGYCSDRVAVDLFNYNRAKANDTQSVVKADAFYDENLDPRLRLTEIMKNIIKNNGTFKP